MYAAALIFRAFAPRRRPADGFPPARRRRPYLWFADDDMHVQPFEQAGRNASVTEVSNWRAAFPEDEQKRTKREYPEIEKTMMKKQRPAQPDRLHREKLRPAAGGEKAAAMSLRRQIIKGVETIMQYHGKIERTKTPGIR